MKAAASGSRENRHERRAASKRARKPPKPIHANALLVSIPQAAILLGLHRQSLWRLTVSGEIPTVMVGSRRMIRRFVIEKIVANGTKHRAAV